MNRENCRFTVAEACFRRFQDAFDDEPSLRAGIRTVIDGTEWNLCSRSGMHRIQVMYKGLHCLICGPLDFLLCIAFGYLLDLLDLLCGQEFFQKLCFLFAVIVIVCHIRYYAEVRLDGRTDFFRLHITVRCITEDIHALAQIVQVQLFIGLFYAAGHTIIKIRYALAAVLIILI